MEEQRARSILVTAAWVIGALAIGLTTSWVVLGRPVAEKLATECAMPLGLIALSLTILCVHAVRERRLRRSVLLFLTWLLCFLAGNGFAANALTNALEARYAGIDPMKLEPFDVVVLLGGSTSETPADGLQVRDSGDRVVLAARMYQRGLIKQIYCTGSRIEGLSASRRDAAEQAKGLLVDLGVPPEAIRRSGGRNTTEELQFIAKAVGGTSVGLLTSAWHLPRAMRIAQEVDLRARPLPSDFLSDPSPMSWPVGKRLRMCIPSLGALLKTTRAVREFLAGAVGR